MARTGIFYGSSTGYTADVAARIGKALGVEAKDIYDVANTAPSMVDGYDILLLGASTWGNGGVQDDFADFLDGLEAMYLPGKKIAVFGCGDQTMGKTFGAAVGEIFRSMLKTGATMIAPFNLDGYDTNGCGAIVDGECVGLVIDEINHPELTDQRISEWVREIK